MRQPSGRIDLDTSDRRTVQLRIIVDKCDGQVLFAREQRVCKLDTSIAGAVNDDIGTLTCAAITDKESARHETACQQVQNQVGSEDDEGGWREFRAKRHGRQNRECQYGKRRALYHGQHDFMVDVPDDGAVETDTRVHRDRNERRSQDQPRITSHLGRPKRIEVQCQRYEKGQRYEDQIGDGGYRLFVSAGQFKKFCLHRY